MAAGTYNPGSHRSTVKRGGRTPGGVGLTVTRPKASGQDVLSEAQALSILNDMGANDPAEQKLIIKQLEVLEGADGMGYSREALVTAAKTLLSYKERTKNG